MPAKYNPYPEYKDSGVGWIGKLPIHWMVMPVKRIAKIVNGSTPKSGEPSFWDGEITWITPSDFGKLNSPYISVGARSITQAGYDSCGSTIVPVETIVLSSRAPIGSLAITAKELCTNQGCKSLVVSKEYYFKYLYYVLLSSTDQLNMLGRGTTFVELSSDELGFYKIAIPCKKDQSQIANFLDHETGKIDALIEKQQQLIKLLQEKRQAVISHAVTKGLNPDAPMKDSGVEWLGQIPAHWEVKRVCQLFSESSRRASTDDELQFPIFSVSIHHGISDKELDEEELDRKVTRSEDRSLYKVVRNNDLAYNMMRAWQGGFGATKLSGLVSPAYVVCNPRTPIDSYFFELVLRTPNAVTELKRYSRGITDFRLRLYWDEFKNILVPVPSGGEVEQILSSIQHTNFLYGKLISVANRQIELLQERRTALISAAVTGKIDVRDWRAPAGSTAYSSQKYRNTGCEDEMEIQNNGEEVADD